MTLKPEDLTEDQVLMIWNGCGADTIPIKPPHLLYGHASIKHDILYYIGGTEEDRLDADKIFLIDCKKAIANHNETGIKKLWYTLWAYVYYFGLRKLGNKGSFEYGAKAECWDDIKKKIIRDRLEAFGADNLDAMKE